jgi:hypothetical protein
MHWAARVDAVPTVAVEYIVLLRLLHAACGSTGMHRCRGIDAARLCCQALLATGWLWCHNGQEACQVPMVLHVSMRTVLCSKAACAGHQVNGMCGCCLMLCAVCKE